jgi:hypothetical protein
VQLLLCAWILVTKATAQQSLGSMHQVFTQHLPHRIRMFSNMCPPSCFKAANNGFGFAGWAEALAGCLTNLEDLRAGGTNATDFDLLALRPLTKLTALDLSDSPEVRCRPETAAWHW